MTFPSEKNDSEFIAPPVFNPDKQRQRFERFQLTKEQEDTLLLSLWNSMRIMAELGHGIEQNQTFITDWLERHGQDSENLITLDKQKDK